MSSVLEHRETDPEGSFVAVGAGLRYRFTAARRHLEIREKRRKNTILQLDTRDIHPRNTLIYTRFLEKTNQIKALMYSNRVTHDLTRTLDRARLQAIVEGDSVIAQYIYDLSQHRFAAFSEQFGAAFNLGQVHISQLSLTGPEQEYFAGSIGTYSGHAIKAHGLTLPSLLYALSERVTQDLVPIEFGADTTANRLLAASSLLNTAARALDEDFIPANKIRTAIGQNERKAKA